MKWLKMFFGNFRYYWVILFLLIDFSHEFRDSMDTNEELNLTEELNKMANDHENRNLNDREMKREDLNIGNEGQPKDYKGEDKMETQSAKNNVKDKEFKRTPSKDSFRSRGMSKIASANSKSGEKREISPEELKMLDQNSNEIVEILKGEGTIKDFPPLRHSPPLEPRKIIYSSPPNPQPPIKSPEDQLPNDSIYIPKTQNSPFKNYYPQSPPITPPSDPYPDFQIPDPITFAPPQYPYPPPSFQYPYAYYPSFEQQKIMYLESQLQNCMGTVSSLRQEVNYLRAQLQQKCTELQEFEATTTQERREELKLNIHLRKLAKYHKKVITDMERENQRLNREIEEGYNRQRQWECEREELKRENERLEGRIGELEMEISRDEGMERGQEIDPFIELKTKQQRIPYHQKSVYVPLTDYNKTYMVG